MLREKLANVQHAIWSHWMRYLFTQGTQNEDGSFTIPAEKVERWKWQMNTPYEQLSEKMRDSDRNQADKILEIFK